MTTSPSNIVIPAKPNWRIIIDVDSTMRCAVRVEDLQTPKIGHIGMQAARQMELQAARQMESLECCSILMQIATNFITVFQQRLERKSSATEKADNDGRISG